jgi:peptidoglycan/xylan/chitin deacetylase (PgdA/CDA1 family)
MIRALREVGCSLGTAGVLVLCYHVVRSAARFAAQLDVLTARGYTTVPLRRVLAWLNGGEPLPAPAVLLTFDDLHAGQVEYAAPVLAERGIPATFFPLAADLADSAKHRRAAAELARAGHTIGAHTHSQGELTALGDADVRRELADARRIVEDVTGRRATAFSYPFGAWNARVAKLVAETGYQAAFTVDLGVVRRGDDPFALRRACVLGEPGPREFDAFVWGVAPLPGALLAAWKIRERWLDLRR